MTKQRGCGKGKIGRNGKCVGAKTALAAAATLAAGSIALNHINKKKIEGRELKEREMEQEKKKQNRAANTKRVEEARERLGALDPSVSKIRGSLNVQRRSLEEESDPEMRSAIIEFGRRNRRELANSVKETVKDPRPREEKEKEARQLEADKRLKEREKRRKEMKEWEKAQSEKRSKKDEESRKKREAFLAKTAKDKQQREKLLEVDTPEQKAQRAKQFNDYLSEEWKKSQKNKDSIIATAIAVKMDRGCGKRMKGEGGKCVPAGGGRLAQGMNNAVSSGDWGAAQKFGGQIVAHEKRIAQARRKKFRQSAGNAFRGTASALNRSADVIQKTAATAIAAKALHELSKRNQEKKDSYIATAIAVKMDGCKRGTVGNGRGQCVPTKGKQSKANKWMGRAVGGALLASPVVAPVAGYMALRQMDKKKQQTEKDLNNARSEMDKVLNSPAGKTTLKRKS